MTATATTTSERFSWRNTGNMTQARYLHAASTMLKFMNHQRACMEAVREVYTLSALADGRILVLGEIARDGYTDSV
ncbi:unnamed protein product [Adineta ricciae]|uniref:Uncharacterized protein n=1 Tax=Adineta ricciae TaxID=249248 RepID=A0A815VYS7_ADIRI|nr:unnamed protein product [Adineta ricciae]